jgi:hypothetical protein
MHNFGLARSEIISGRACLDRVFFVLWASHQARPKPTPLGRGEYMGLWRRDFSCCPLYNSKFYSLFDVDIGAQN